MKKRKVAEAVPVQVYLGVEERARLERLAKELDASRADVLRRGLEALERELLDLSRHPLLRLSGIAKGERGPRVRYDIAEQHDRYLSDALRWAERKRRRRGGT